MKRSVFLATVFAVVLTVVLPFVGGSGPSLTDASQSRSAAVAASTVQAGAAVTQVTTTAVVARTAAPDIEHVAQKPVPAAAPAAGTAGGASVSGSVSITGGSAGAGTGSTGGTAGGSSSSAASRPAAAPAQPAPAVHRCPANVGGSTGGADGAYLAGGLVQTTTAADLASFAHEMNAIRVANCLPPVPLANYRYDSCMQTRLIWIAEDPSPDVNSAWGHKGTVRSDGVPEPADCDGDLAGGAGNTGAVVAQKWWASPDHRASLYRPTYTGSTAHVCILFAMVHGGLPNDGLSFTRAASRWVSC